MNEIQQKNARRSRVSLVLLALVFILPIALAWIVSKNKALQPTQTKNNGTLFEPVRPLQDFALQTAANKPFTLEDMRRKWSYVYLAGVTCNTVCRDSLIKIRDARLAQSGEATRVEYYLFYTTAPSANEQQELISEHPRLTILLVGSQQQSLLDMFKLNGETEPVAAQRVYLIDPIGNLMMYYPEGSPGNGLLKDLRHLLQWSQIG